jgi:predicted membrane protein
MVVPSWDLAIFSEAAKAYAHLQAPIVEIKGLGYNLLGDHFHPILVLLGPVWRLFPSPLSLLVVQDLLLALSAWPLTRLATRLLGRWVGGALGLAYVLSWGIQGGVQSQFHEVAFAVPLLAWAGVAFVERRWWACAMWCIPLMLVKEDLGLTVFMAGLALAWRGWRERRRASRQLGSPREPVLPEPAGGSSADGAAQAGAPTTPTPRPRILGRCLARARTWHEQADSDPLNLGLGLALAGVTGFLLTTLVILPALNPDGTWAYSLSGGASQGGADGTLVKAQTTLILVLTAGVAGLGSPWMALVLPTLAWRFLGSIAFYWDWRFWHYNLVLMPIALTALLDVAARWGVQLAWRRWTARAVAAVPVVLMLVIAPRLPLWDLTSDYYGREPLRAQAAHKVLDTVPQDATVETDLGLLAYLVPRATVSWVGTSQGAPDYVVVDRYSPAWGGRPPADAAVWASERTKVGYTLVLNEGGYQVARRNG